jgi:hypothetical protein
MEVRNNRPPPEELCNAAVVPYDEVVELVGLFACEDHHRRDNLRDLDGLFEKIPRRPLHKIRKDR